MRRKDLEENTTRDGAVSDRRQRRVLLAVAGLSPQVITETLYALAVCGGEPWIPDEIRVLTTAEGAHRIRLQLLDPDSGRFWKLCADYSLPAIRFDAECIDVITDSAGAALDDIRTPDDNARAADIITERVRALTADPLTQLHVSLAGGRKTMGYYLGYALSLYGRSSDELSHVLVSDRYEGHPDFFYPTPRTQVIYARDGKPLDTSAAKVSLARIPFVSLRHGIPSALLNGKAGFNETVAAIRRSLGPVELAIDLDRRAVRAAGLVFHVPPAELALLALFARRALGGMPAIPAPNKEVADEAWAENYLRELKRIVGKLGDVDKTEYSLRKGMDGNYFSARLAKMKKALVENLGPAATPYLIRKEKGRGGKYALAIPAGSISFCDVGPMPMQPGKKNHK